jgi:hypothetical protein
MVGANAIVRLEMDNHLEWLQRFFGRLCDGDWEHAYGFRIENLDNPGWYLDFDLADTKLAQAVFVEIKEDRSQTDWIMCRKVGDKFDAAGGVYNLNELLGIFRTWVDRHLPPGESPWKAGP